MTGSYLRLGVLLGCLAVAGCASVEEPAPAVIEPVMAADLGGSWERDFARDDDVNATLQRAYRVLARSVTDRQRSGVAGGLGLPSGEAQSLLALARLVEMITRPAVLRISQEDDRILVHRKDDFSLSCNFSGPNGASERSTFGAEYCAWQGSDLVSLNVLPGGLRVEHRFTVSDDGQRMRVITTASAPQSRTPFSLRRFYLKFEEPAPAYDCVETFSMKRVCSTGELDL